jgi:CHAD domain-containing protein
MAKADEVEGLEAGDRFDVAARKVVAVRARELFEHADGVLDTTDIERVHNMRVASRRLRAVLEIFAGAF